MTRFPLYLFSYILIVAICSTFGIIIGPEGNPEVSDLVLSKGLDGLSAASLIDIINNLFSTVDDLKTELREKTAVESCEGQRFSGPIALRLTTGAVVDAYCIVDLLGSNYLVVSKAMGKWPSSDMLYNYYDDDNQASQGYAATADFSIPVRHLFFRPVEIIGAGNSDLSGVYGFRTLPEFVQENSFSPLYADRGSCIVTDAFYSPDPQGDGLQYGYRMTAFTGGLTAYRTAGGSTGGIDFGSTNCDTTGYSLGVHRTGSTHQNRRGIMGSVSSDNPVNWYKSSTTIPLYAFDYYQSANFSNFNVTADTASPGFSPVWIALR